MPLYDIEHIIPLDTAQQESLAKRLTALHAARFCTPSYFLNVRFTDVSNMPVYRGGVLRKYNRAILRTRRSENRSVEIYNEHCRDIIKVWREIVGDAGEMDLRTVWVLGALTTAVEAGFERPMARFFKSAGDEIGWLKQHKDEFQALADAGDEDFIGLMHEIETRPDFAEIK